MKRSCGTVEGGPCWGRAGCTALHGVRLSSAPSGDRPANPARVPGRSGLPRVPFSVLSARKRSGAESLATPSGISRAATSVASCRSSVSGHRSSSSKYTRGQSRETGSLSRLFSSVETTAKCISLGPADCRERLSYSIRRSAATFQRVVSHKSRYGGLQGLFRRCPYSGHLWRCWVVYAPNLHQILWPRSASHSWLCCSLAVAVHSTHWAGIGNSGGVDISFP